MNILVTGANGQLGNEMRCIAATSLNNYIFTDVAELDITDLDAIRNMIHLDNIKVIVNCAAYTNVDKAEDDYDMADLLNNKAVENLAIAAKEVNATLIHISTDYVFQGDKNMPCGEDCETNPLGIYGKTKRAGAEAFRSAGSAASTGCQIKKTERGGHKSDRNFVRKVKDPEGSGRNGSRTGRKAAGSL